MPLRPIYAVIERELRSAGAEYWTWVVDMSLRGEPARFARPERLDAR